MKKPLVYVIILNWKGLKDLIECIKSLYNLDYPNYKIIVCDNGSTDESVNVIQEMFHQIDLIKNGKNYGYAGGNNIGIRYAINRDADYVWLLNNDVVVEKDCLTKLINLAESDSSIGLVSPLIYFYEDPEKIQFAGSKFDFKNISIIYPNYKKKLDEYQKGENICLWGTALLIKKEVIKRIGMLKEEYFAYWEDTEYSIRAIKAGFKNRVCEEAKVFHKGQPKTMQDGRKGGHFYYFMERNRCLLGIELLKNWKNILKFKIKYLGELSEHLNRYPKKYQREILNGAWQGLNGITGSMRMDIEMPFFLKYLLLFFSKCHPIFISNIIIFNFDEIKKKLKEKLFKIKKF